MHDSNKHLAEEKMVADALEVREGQRRECCQGILAQTTEYYVSNTNKSVMETLDSRALQRVEWLSMHNDKLRRHLY